MTAAEAVLLAIAIPVLAAIPAGLLGRWKTASGVIALAAVTASSLFAAFAALRVFAAGPDAIEIAAVSLPSLGSALRFHVDGLSAFFLLIIAIVTVPAALYSIGYMAHDKNGRAGSYYANLLLFIAGMYGIVTLTDLMVFFFLFWQLMTVPSYLLVRFERDHPANVRAANRYLLMMEIACVAVLLATGILGYSHASVASVGAAESYRFDFDHLSLASHSPGIVSIAMALFIIGFGIKAGMWPFGKLWLPDAHPAAPSPVSALMSGVLIKTGVYGLIRTLLWLPSPGTAGAINLRAWGLAVAILGALTLFLGTARCFLENRSKRLLAFSSIGQVGYMILALGVATTLAVHESPAARPLAGLAFAALLFHALNHALYKSLLFLSAGSALVATGTQDMNRMGGLMKYMPFSGAIALVASLSIAGVPGFNGFASKWAIYASAILAAPHEPLLALLAGVAILTGVLTLACFMNFFGVIFLSRPTAAVNEAAARGAIEVTLTMRAAKAILAALCILLGLVPSLGYALAARVLLANHHGLATILAAPAVTTATAGPFITLTTPGGAALLAPLVAVVALGLLAGLARMIARAGGSTRRVAEPWLCGYARETDGSRYTARHLFGEVRDAFRWIGLSAKDTPQ